MHGVAPPRAAFTAVLRCSLYGRLVLRLTQRSQILVDMELFTMHLDAAAGVLVLRIATGPDGALAGRLVHHGSPVEALSATTPPGSVIVTSREAEHAARALLVSEAPGVLELRSAARDQPGCLCDDDLRLAVAWWRWLGQVAQPEGFGPGAAVPGHAAGAAPEPVDLADSELLLAATQSAAQQGLAAASGVAVQRAYFLACVLSARSDLFWVYELLGDIACVRVRDLRTLACRPRRCRGTLVSLEIKYSRHGTGVSDEDIERQQAKVRALLGQALPHVTKHYDKHQVAGQAAWDRLCALAARHTDCMVRAICPRAPPVWGTLALAAVERSFFLRVQRWRAALGTTHDALTARTLTRRQVFAMVYTGMRDAGARPADPEATAWRRYLRAAPRDLPEMPAALAALV